MAVEEILLRYFMGSVQIKASAKPIVEFPTENVIHCHSTDNYIKEKKNLLTLTETLAFYIFQLFYN